MGLLKKLFGTSSEKELRAIKPIVDKIEALDGENLKESVQAMLSTVISTEVQAHMGELKHMDAENWREVCAQFRGLFLRPDEFKFTDEELQQYDAQALTDLLQERASDIYARKEAELG